jgi:2,4-dienoyl-CoA reductase-like NADH-dependent reductase (Old Yellow Enzyme family)
MGNLNEQLYSMTQAEIDSIIQAYAQARIRF